MIDAGLRPAVFLDRDGTLIEDVGYIRDPAAVRLLPDAASAVRAANAAGLVAVVVSNQSGIARGLLTEADVASVRARIVEQLAEGGARIDAWYHCPHHPDFGGGCDCRKPGIGLFKQAIAEHRIDPTRSTFIGDRWRDVSPAIDLGGHGILVPGPATPADDIAQSKRDAAVAPSLRVAVAEAVRTAGGAATGGGAGPLRLAVFASGGGSNLQSIIDYFEGLADPKPCSVTLVVSDRAGAFALTRATRRGIATAVLTNPGDGAAIVELLDAHRIDLVALAGYLKRVPPAVTRRWDGAIVNIHPALLPRFGGAGMYGRRVHEAVLASGDAESGATVHFVDDEYDHGAILAQERVPVDGGDTVDSLAARVLEAEHRVYPRALHELARRTLLSRRA